MAAATATAEITCRREQSTGELIVRGLLGKQVVETAEEFEAAATRLAIPEFDPEKRPNKHLVKLLLGGPPPPLTTPRPTIDWSRYPQETQDKILSYQKETVEAIVGHLDGKCLLTAIMGMGKTMMALLVAFFYGGETLIVAPTSTLMAWQRECLRWTGMVATICHHVTDDRHPITIASYNIAKTNAKIYTHTWNTVIFDESHTLKNPSAECTKRLIPIGIRARCCLMLSATPRLKCNSELYSQILPLLGSRVVGTWTSFTKRYCSAKMEVRWGRNQLTMGAQRYKPELNALLSKCMIRLSIPPEERNLPSCHRHLEEFTLPPDSEEVCEMNRIYTQYQLSRNKDERDMLHMDLWRRTGRAKLAHSSRWIIRWLEAHPGEKLVVFAAALPVLNHLSTVLEDAGVSHAVIHGSVDKERRHVVVSDLAAAEMGKYRVGLLSIGTCALGITLCPGVSTCLFAEMVHTPALLEQCEGKLHRIGAVRPVHCHWLIASNTIESSLLSTIQRKTDANSQVLDGRKRCLLFEGLGGAQKRTRLG